MDFLRLLGRRLNPFPPKTRKVKHAVSGPEGSVRRKEKLPNNTKKAKKANKINLLINSPPPPSKFKFPQWKKTNKSRVQPNLIGAWNSNKALSEKQEKFVANNNLGDFFAPVPKQKGLQEIGWNGAATKKVNKNLEELFAAAPKAVNVPKAVEKNYFDQIYENALKIRNKNKTAKIQNILSLYEPSETINLVTKVNNKNQSNKNNSKKNKSKKNNNKNAVNRTTGRRPAPLNKPAGRTAISLPTSRSNMYGNFTRR